MSLEKILKAFFVLKNKESAPHIHDLTRLAILSGIKIDKEKEDNLAIITTFNVASRYSDYKMAFYKKADRKFSLKYKKITIELFIWLKKEFQKKLKSK